MSTVLHSNLRMNECADCACVSGEPNHRKAYLRHAFVDITPLSSLSSRLEFLKSARLESLKPTLKFQTFKPTSVFQVDFSLSSRLQSFKPTSVFQADFTLSSRLQATSSQFQFSQIKSLLVPHSNSSPALPTRLATCYMAFMIFDGRGFDELASFLRDISRQAGTANKLYCEYAVERLEVTSVHSQSISQLYT